ncbi:MAG: hypothetical protein DRO92_02805 [Candidatus Altiarchaeales archaeon]|nr:MAG: hypothetical protein DRO92_02805 [Candidatus Altiarchaeales archaeon]
MKNKLLNKEIMEKDVLNRIKWDKNLNPSDFVIYYIDRERESEQMKKINFTERELRGDFFSVNNSTNLIPMQRIRRITCRGKIVWSRAQRRMKMKRE